MTLAVIALLALSQAAGLVAGIFLTFSDFAMRSFLKSAPAAGSEVMQVLNREVFRSLFMVLLLGLVPVSAAVSIYALVALRDMILVPLVLAGLFYVIGVFGVTAAGNVPMNQKLAAMPDASAEAQAYWPDYARGWTRWNHVRTAAALVASLCYAIAAVMLAGTA